MTNFDTYIADALAKGWKEGARRMKMEKRMASALVRACLDRSYVLSVHNGEEWAIKHSKSYRAVMNVLWQTDEETLRISKDDGLNTVGWFSLIYGNDGWDVVADYSDTPACNEIWETVISPLSDKLCLAA